MEKRAPPPNLDDEVSSVENLKSFSAPHWAESTFYVDNTKFYQQPDKW